MHTFTADELGLGCGIVMEISYQIIGICEPAMSSSLFSVICSWFFIVSQLIYVATINPPNLYAKWMIYIPPKVKLYKSFGISL